MKATLLAATLALSMTPLATAWAAAGTDDQSRTADAPAAATHSGHGKINSIDLGSATVNLTHDPIKSLKWPKMTMQFKVHDPAILKALKPGDQVDFELMKLDGRYQITKISRSVD